MTDHTGFDRAGSVSLGVVVILLYALFVSAVFSGFATYIYRSEWHASLTTDVGAPRDLDNLIFAIKREDQLLTEITELQTQLQTVVAIMPAPEPEEAESAAAIPLDYNTLRNEQARKREELAALPFTPEERAKGRARFEALQTKLFVVGDTFQRLVSFPTIFLTLIVTIAAGGLGTVVAFSRRYYNGQESPSMARLFVNVGEGIAAAIAIFLFSGAGMLALTQGAGSQNAVELSPYTVAFIAFLSGFMAEDAFGSIQSAGKRIFQRDAPQQEKPPKAQAPVFTAHSADPPDKRSDPAA